jgi:uroporphyrinogen decarboxylase
MPPPAILRHISNGQLPPLKFVPEPLLDLLAGFSSVRGRLQELSSLERILAAMRHKESDRVPVTPLLCAGARHISGIAFPDYSLDADKAARVFMDGFQLVGGDLVILMLDLSVEAADFGQQMQYPPDSTAYPDYSRPFITDHNGYTRIRRIALSDAPRMTEFVRLCRIMVKSIGFKGVVTGFVFGPLGVLSMMRGAEHLFKDCIRYPKQVKGACETITGVLIDYVNAQCDAGVPAVAIDTLFASRSGLSKDLWEQIEGPFAREISLAIKRKGRLVGIHNCGHDVYFDAQIRSMEPDAISFAHLPDDCQSRRELKEKYGDQVTLIGYIPTPLLVHGSPRAVMDECRRQIDDLAPGGGYILAPGCEYPPNISLTNAFALVKAAEVYG